MPMPAMPAKPRLPEQNCPPGKEYVFKRPNGQEVGRARNISEFVVMLKRAPIESILYHANAEHFTPWLTFMAMPMAAQKAKLVKGKDEDVRKRLIMLFE